MLTSRRSKTDREGAGATVAVPFGAEEATCPVGALRRWLDTAAVSEGRVFRRIDRHGHLGPTLSDRALAEIVSARNRVDLIKGVDPNSGAGMAWSIEFEVDAPPAPRSQDRLPHRRMRDIIVTTDGKTALVEAPP